MKQFVVFRHVNVTYRWYVDAETKEEAREQSETMYIEDGDAAEYDRETTEICIEEITDGEETE